MHSTCLSHLTFIKFIILLGKMRSDNYEPCHSVIFFRLQMLLHRNSNILLTLWSSNFSSSICWYDVPPEYTPVLFSIAFEISDSFPAVYWRSSFHAYPAGEESHHKQPFQRHVFWLSLTSHYFLTSEVRLMNPFTFLNYSAIWWCPGKRVIMRSVL